MVTKSTFVNASATEKCEVSICMFFVKQIQLCGQNNLWTSSLVSRRSSMYQEGFLNDDQNYFYFFCAKENCDIQICIYIVLCETRSMDGTFELLSTLRSLYKTRRNMMVPEDSGTFSKVRKSSKRITRSTFVIFELQISDIY